MRTLRVLALGLWVFCVPMLMAADDLWGTDFEKAKASAAEKGLPILIDFTGSDWCGWCIRLDKEVFSKAEFQGYASANLVLLKIDFPRKKLPAAEAASNQELAKTYGIQGYPTIVLADAEGKELARTGYRPGGPDAYVAHLKELLKK